MAGRVSAGGRHFTVFWLTLRPSRLGFSHYGEPKNFGIVSGGLNEQFACFRREVESLITSVRAFEIGPRLWTRLAPVRHVLVWLPDTRDRDYCARMGDQTRRLTEPTVEEDTMAAAFE